MNQRFDIRYLEDPKDAMGLTNDPAEVLDHRAQGPAGGGTLMAYAFMDALELTEGAGQRPGVRDQRGGRPARGREAVGLREPRGRCGRG